MDSSPPVWIEIAKAVPSVVTAGVAIWGLMIARAGLTKWRQETIGKRKAELAEEVLADFYQARDIINSARSPGSFAEEGASRKKADWESPGDTQTLNAYFAPAERLANKQEFFAQFHARRYRFIAHFGTEAGKPYLQLHEIYAKIITGCRMLVITYRQREMGSLPRDREKWEAAIGWGLTEGDPLSTALDGLVEAIEAVCRPAIREATKI